MNRPYTLLQSEPYQVKIVNNVRIKRKSRQDIEYVEYRILGQQAQAEEAVFELVPPQGQQLLGVCFWAKIYLYSMESHSHF